MRPIHPATIYKCTNLVNGKAYIGFDSAWPKRIRTHHNHSLNINSKHYNCSFHRATRKYGWENFEWVIIYQSTDKLHTLNEMESFFIKEYDTYKNGYNETLGGLGNLGAKWSTEAKQKVSGKNSYMYGKKGLKHPCYGLKRPDHLAKKFIVIDPNGAEREIFNLTKFCRDNQLTCPSMINIAQQKKGYKTHKGWKCKYAADSSCN